MAGKLLFSSLAAVGILVAGFNSPEAAWIPCGVVISAAPEYQGFASMLADGAGGAFIAWEDYRNGEKGDIYAQHISSTGSALWDVNGRAICTAADDQFLPLLVSDGAGGMIIAWYDYRPGDRWQIYAQRLDASGNIQWAENGLFIADSIGSFAIVSDEAGGAIVAYDKYESTNGNDVYAQRFDGAGLVQWTPGGVAITAIPNNQRNPGIVPDGAGGAIAAWMDDRAGFNATDVYAQRVDASGAVQWVENGVALSAASGSQILLGAMIPDGSGGAIAAWKDTRGGTFDIYAQSVDDAGVVQWAVDGVTVCAAAYGQEWPVLATDGAGGAIIAWRDTRSMTQHDIYAQRIDAAGNARWTADGTPICVAPQYQETPAILSDGSGGAIIAWNDQRSWPELDLYAQRIDSSGAIHWATDGILICGETGYQRNALLASDGYHGTLIAWEDARQPGDEGNLFAQRLLPSGIFAYEVTPRLESVLDVPDDEGGWVQLTLRAAERDRVDEPLLPVTGYNVWRRVGAPAFVEISPSAAGRAGIDIARAAPDLSLGARLTARQATSLGLPPGEWESVGFHAAIQDTVYELLAPTRNDSTESGAARELFAVTSHTESPWIFFACDPDSGYSVDNLAPGQTTGFAGIQSLDPAGLRLSWDPNPAPDVLHYDVHRGDDALFEPDETNLVAATSETGMIDGDWHPALQHFYKLVAVDRHGNRSAAALLRPEDITVGTLLASHAASFVDGAIVVSWRLSEDPGNRRFAALRAEGGAAAFEELADAAIARDGLSFSLRDARVAPGSSYRYRIDICGEDGRTMLLETELISTPPMPLTLYQNVPNPFNPSTSISFYLPEKGIVSLEVFDIAGRRVVLLSSGERNAGLHIVAWDGTGEGRRPLSSGVYFYRLSTGKATRMKKMVLLR